MPIIVPDGTPWIPTPGDVAAIERARLRGQGGNVPDNFTATTSPTYDQVATLIGQQAPFVLLETGGLSDTELLCSQKADIRQAVRTLIAQRVAAVIELSYWPEEVVTTQTAEDFWRHITEVDQPAVVQAAKECRMGEIEPENEPPVPMGSFNGPRVGDAGRW